MVRSALGKVSPPPLRILAGEHIGGDAPAQAGDDDPASPAAALPLPCVAVDFSSPAAGHPSAAVVRVRRIPKLQGLQHLPFICKGTEGMQWLGKKRFFSVEAKAKDAKLMESARSSVKRLMAWLDEQAKPTQYSHSFNNHQCGIYLGMFIRECLRSDEHAKDCTTADNRDRNSSYRSAEYGCHDPCPSCSVCCDVSTNSFCNVVSGNSIYQDITNSLSDFLL